MKKDKCFYCGEKMQKGENKHSVTIDFKHIICCSAKCLLLLNEYFEFVQSNKKWWVSGLVVGVVLIFLSGFLFIASVVFGTVAVAVGWGVTGLTVYFFPAITTQANFLMPLRKMKKIAKITGFIMMVTAPLWFLVLFIVT
ncbi:MAG: hypothetical protein FWE44_07570 [Defluviitaleaceae bacterium]|nr:hypothetical protein [Defluviitaleaceae bacterium]